VNTTFFASVAATGFAVAFLHAALPTHWLPFVLVGRAQKWTTGRTLGVTLLAGLGHVGLTILLGLAVTAGAAIALAADLLEDLHLLALAGFEKGAGHDRAFNQGSADRHGLAFAKHQDFAESDFRARFTVELFDNQQIAGLDPVLLAAGFDHRVHRLAP